MSNKARVPDFLWHLIICCNRLSKLRSEVSYQEFLADYRVHELALRILEVLGEAAKRIETIDPDYFEVKGMPLFVN